CVLSTSARPPSPRLCPYTTLFRSEDDGQGRDRGSRCEREVAAAEPAEPEPLLDHPRVGLRRRELSERVEAAPFGLELLECLAVLGSLVQPGVEPRLLDLRQVVERSEEHTSELQSREKLV